MRRADNLHVPIALKSVILSLLEPSGPVQACNGIALPFFFFLPCGYFRPPTEILAVSCVGAGQQLNTAAGFVDVCLIRRNTGCYL